MKTTVEMAKEAGFTWEPIGNIIGPLERFAALVRADEREQSLQREKFIAERWAIECASQVEIEREACAKVCDKRYMGDNNREDIEAKRCAAAIRARSNT
jgi:hypothetical protein